MDAERRGKSLTEQVVAWIMRGVAALALFFLSQIYQDTRATAARVADLTVKVAVLEERTRKPPEVYRGPSD